MWEAILPVRMEMTTVAVRSPTHEGVVVKRGLASHFKVTMQGTRHRNLSVHIETKAFDRASASVFGSYLNECASVFIILCGEKYKYTQMRDSLRVRARHELSTRLYKGGTRREKSKPRTNPCSTWHLSQPLLFSRTTTLPSNILKLCPRIYLWCLRVCAYAYLYTCYALYIYMHWLAQDLPTQKDQYRYAILFHFRNRWAAARAILHPLLACFAIHFWFQHAKPQNPYFLGE